MNTEQLQALSKAQFLQINGNYDLALQEYTILQTQAGEDYQVYISKAICLIALNNYESALKECENAIHLDRNRWEGLYRRAICNYFLGQYKAAILDFQDIQDKLDIKKDVNFIKNIDAYVGRCNAELNNTNLTDLIEQGGIKAPNKIADADKMEIEKPKQPVIKPVSGIPQKIVYTWYQTDTKVGIEISYPLSDASKLECTITETNVSVSFPTSTGSNYDLDIDYFGRVKPKSKKVSVGLQKIDIVVEKIKVEHWQKLNAEERLPEQTEEQKEEEIKEEKKPKKVVAPTTTHSYPSSNTRKKNWDKIDLEIEKDMEKNKEDYQEGDALNGIFKQIYQGSDEKTRLAMMKSFQQSGGTVLSTNWDEVKDKDYEGKDRPSPPKGQEYAKWGE